MRGSHCELPTHTCCLYCVAVHATLTPPKVAFLFQIGYDFTYMMYPIAQTLAKLLIACSILMNVSIALPASAIGPLVKASGSTVYFATQDGGRYFFPNESVYASWYTNFNDVSKIIDEDLASLALRGNTLYRPGSVLIKITTEPKVYAVSRYGILHWVTTEQIAKALYGDTWNKRVVDVPDSYFSNYIVGKAVLNASDYSVTQEMNSAINPQENIRPITFVPPAQDATNALSNIPTLDATVSLNTHSAVQNQDVDVNATVIEHSSPISKIEIHSDETAGPLTTCLNTTICTYRLIVNRSPLTVKYSVTVTDTLGKTFTTAINDRPMLSVASTSDQVQISSTQQSISTGSKTSFTSTSNGIQGVTSHKIYALVPGELAPILWKNCGTVSPCSASTIFYRTTSLYSDVQSNGQHFISKPITITTVGGEAPRPTLSVIGHPAPNHVELSIHVPTGEMILPTTLTDGPSISDEALAMCDADCTLTVQINKQSGITAFTWVGGKYERSETVTIMP